MNRRFLPYCTALLLLNSVLFGDLFAQRSESRTEALAANQTKGGAALLSTFGPVSAASRGAVVKVEVDKQAVALGAVIDVTGLVLTKASEIPDGDLTCVLPNGRRVPGKLVASDEDTDLGLIQITARDLKAIEWTKQSVNIGQWAVTPGIDTVPEAVGIVSAPLRKIYPKRALLGVQLDFNNSTAARIAEILPGLGAEKAGLKPGDIVLSVNEAIVTSSEDLMQLLRGYRDGETVRLKWRRDTEELKATVQMTLLKPDERARRFDRQERMNRLGSQLSRRAEGFQLAIQHDSVLQPWECGGPLLNLDGKAIGLNIARAGRIASYALPADLVQRKVKELKEQIHDSVQPPPATQPTAARRSDG